MNTKVTITARTEGHVFFSNGFSAERVVTKMSGNTVWVCRYPEGAQAAAFSNYKEASAFCKEQKTSA